MGWTDRSLTASPNGGWQSVTGGSAVQYNGIVYFGWVDNHGNVAVATYDEATGAVSSPTVLHAALEVDWHDNPTILVRSDGRIVCVYGEHAGAETFVRISTNPEDITAFGAEFDIAGDTGCAQFTYPNLFEDTGGDLHLFYRDGTAAPGSNPKWCESVSTDGGLTWSAQTIIWNAGTNHPTYWKVDYDGANRYDFSATSGTADADNASIYHWYRDSGTYKKSDGSAVGGALPLQPAEVTLIHNGATGGSRYPYWLVGGTNPSVTWPEFTGSTPDWYYGRWNGSAWVVNSVVSDGNTGEPWAEGGFALEYDDPTVAWLSRVTGGKYQVFRYTTANNGVTWTGTQVSSSPTDDFYPIAVRNADKLRAVWVRGTATAYTDYTLSIRGALEADSGTAIEWDGAVFTNERVREWTIQRGASAELTGGSNSDSATIILINTPDDRYNPENTGGDLYGLLEDGPRVWIGVNEDGTLEVDPDKNVYGLHAGRITDISLLPEPGATVAPFVELVTEGPLAWLERQNVRLADSTTRSQADLRADILAAAGVVNVDLPAEPATLPLSGVDGSALRALEAINAANGTRHFAKPENTSDLWYKYTAIRRTSRLDGTYEASVDAGAEHVTGTSGWRRSADGVINRQRASVEDISFPARVVAWQHDSLPLTIDTSAELWADFGDFVLDPEVAYTATGSPTVTITPFGDTAKVTITAAGVAVFSKLEIRGYLVQRGSAQSIVVNDTTSQAAARGVREGSDLSGDYLGTLTSAHGFATHIVWRFGNPLYRPTMTVVNWLPEQFQLDLFDRISFTSAQLGVTDRIFEIVGLTHHGVHAAADDDGDPTAILHEVTYVLQESRVQTAKAWFILDSSLLDSTDVLAY